MIRTLPPTGAPIPISDLVHGVSSFLKRNGAEDAFRHSVGSYFDVTHVFFASSGKAALFISLDALQQTSKRREVIIPAYSSFCLASAVARTGLSIRLCDIDPDTLDFDLDKLRSLVSEKTLAVVPVHNYGLVCNMAEITAIAGEKGVRVVEDAAQAAGAAWKDRKAGSIGNIGIISLGRGKNVCALNGGGILIRDASLASAVENSMREYAQDSVFSIFASLASGVAISLFLNPSAYILPSSLPFLKLGANEYDPGFKIARFPSLNAEIGMRSFSHIDRYNQLRIRNADRLRNILGFNEALRLPRPIPDGQPVYLRFPTLFDNKAIRDMAFQATYRERLGTSCSYPSPLCDIVPFKRLLVGNGAFPGARFVAERILTFPTHPYVTEKDILRTSEVLSKIFSSTIV
jgi:dTDP-4-amino-4,6-dideoxygalactose transaminase